VRFEGRLTGWNDEQGFGFIEPDQGRHLLRACHGDREFNLREDPVTPLRLAV